MNYSSPVSNTHVINHNILSGDFATEAQQSVTLNKARSLFSKEANIESWEHIDALYEFESNKPEDLKLVFDNSCGFAPNNLAHDESLNPSFKPLPLHLSDKALDILAEKQSVLEMMCELY